MIILAEQETLTAERLREILDYDPETGIFRWKVNCGNNRIVGQIAGTTRLSGNTSYIIIEICKKKYRAHRLAYLYMNDKWPKDQIDHKDRNGTNNRWNNIRDATNAENQRNTKISKNNKSGFLGVSWNKKWRKWTATIGFNRKDCHLGYFETKEEAAAAYAEARKKYFGEFA